MPSQLESRIGALRGRVRRLLALHGAGRVVVATTLAILAAATLDWLIHFVPEVRVALLGLLGLLAAWVGWRHLLAPLVVRFRDLDIALKIERRWPGLNDRLSSTVEFLHAGGSDPQDRSLGSPALRDATVARTLKRNWTASTSARWSTPGPPADGPLGALGVAGPGAWRPWPSPRRPARIALTRLFRPYSGLEWPKQTELESPQFAGKVARGEPFELAVAVRKGKTVPASAKVIYTFADGESSTEALRPDDRGVFHGRIDAVERPFTFSDRGRGRPRTGRHQVQVVPPPALKNLTVALTPPPTPARAAPSWLPGHTQVRAVEGTCRRDRRPVDQQAPGLGPPAGRGRRRPGGRRPWRARGTSPSRLASSWPIRAPSGSTSRTPRGSPVAGADPVRPPRPQGRGPARRLRGAPRRPRDHPRRRPAAADHRRGRLRPPVRPAPLQGRDRLGSEPTKEGIVPLWEPASGPAPVLRQVRDARVEDGRPAGIPRRGRAGPRHRSSPSTPTPATSCRRLKAPTSARAASCACGS